MTKTNVTWPRLQGLRIDSSVLFLFLFLFVFLFLFLFLFGLCAWDIDQSTYQFTPPELDETFPRTRPSRAPVIMCTYTGRRAGLNIRIRIQ